MQKWDYLILRGDIPGKSVTLRTGSVKREETIILAKDLGQEGWELVAATRDGASREHTLFFKRPSIS